MTRDRRKYLARAWKRLLEEIGSPLRSKKTFDVEFSARLLRDEWVVARVTPLPPYLPESTGRNGDMARYTMEIFGQRMGQAEPVRRQTHQINAQDDPTAKVEAQLIFDALAAKMSLTNFALWDDAGKLVCETVGKDAR